MPTSTAPTQAVADRRAAEAALRDVVVKIAPAHLSLVDATRRWLRDRLPTAHEIIYEYRDCVVISCSPSDRGYEGVFAIRASADAVKLYVQRGKGMRDPAKLLHGSAQARWLHVETAQTLARAEVAALVDDAIAQNRVPFPTTGTGRLVVLARKTARETKAVKKTAKKKTAKKKTAKKKRTVRAR